MPRVSWVSHTSLQSTPHYRNLSAQMYGVSVILLAVASQVLGHARVTVPTPRGIGSANLAACGAPVNSVLKADLTAPIENAVAKKDSTYNAKACHIYFCRGHQWEDNKSNIRSYPVGSVVSFHVESIASHTGHANVSIVDTATQTTIGPMLFYWPVYAKTGRPAGETRPANETNFEVTIPDLKGKCATAGACAIQWWWYADSNGQTYESCVDFTQ